MNATDSADLHLQALGWDRPFARAAADALATLAGPDLDFSGITLLVPGGRAGRRIVALLADLAGERQVAMIPPTICTPGNLPETLLDSAGQAAGDLAQGAAWARALMNMDPDLREKIFPRPPGRDDFSNWYRVADILSRCRQELAGGLLTFADVADRAAKSIILGDADRWLAAAAAEEAYLVELAAADLVDPQQSRNEAIAAGNLRECRQLVIAGVAQMNAQLRALIHAAAGRGTRVDIFLYAPEELRGRFDALGCVKPDAWTRATLPLERADIRVALAPDDVARAVFRAIAQMPQPPRADDLTLGVLDDTLAPFVRAEAAALEIPVRHGVGTPLPQTRPYQLLSAVAGFLETRRYRDFQILVRHPDVLAHLSANWKPEPPRREPDWLTLLDEYAASYLPDRLTDDYAEPAAWRSTAENRDAHRPPDLAWLYARVRDFAGATGDANATGKLPSWAAPILATLHAAYARTWNQAIPEELVIVQSCNHLRDALRQLHTHTLAVDETLVTHAEALRIALVLASAARTVPEFTGNTIDMVGWLELMPDDSSRLLVAGFNDGSVPEAAKPDPFLNNTVRKALGLADDDERYARDAYLLSAILESRPPHSVTLITGRCSNAGDPLLPSRLLFAGDPALIAERVKAYTDYQHAPPPPALAYRHRPGASSNFGNSPLPPADKILIPSTLPVTAFRAYLASPKGFYLQYLHNGGLETLDPENPRELLVMDFGNLVHAIVHEALAPTAAADSASAWEDRLQSVLHKRVHEVYGDRLTASLRFQVALLEKRFSRLAEWQFAWWKDGWRTRFCEWSPAKPAGLEVDGKIMGLSGRIDRIDVHEGTGEVAVLDYKVCTGDKTPEKTHQSAGGWVDLQLPLYSALAAEIIGGAPLKLGYVRIADQPQFINAALANWDPAILTDALEAARQVVRNIRNKAFDSPGDNPPTDGAFGYIFGEGLLITDEDPGEEGEP